MPKASSPVRLERDLMASAALDGEAFHRSAAEQIEYWASIGRHIAQQITPNELLELYAGLVNVRIEKASPATIDSDALLDEVDQVRESGTLKYAVVGEGPCYQASIAKPGFLEQVWPDGTVKTGVFKDGSFEALE